MNVGEGSKVTSIKRNIEQCVVVIMAISESAASPDYDQNLTSIGKASLSETRGVVYDG